MLYLYMMVYGYMVYMIISTLTNSAFDKYIVLLLYTCLYKRKNMCA